MLFDAVGACSRMLRVSGRLDIDGVVGGQPVRARLWYGVMMDAALRLETREGSTARPFVFSAFHEEGRLFLPNDNTTISGPSAAAILNAAFGLPLRPATWERILVCPTAGSGGGFSAENLGAGWLRSIGSGRDGMVFAYFKRLANGEWDLVTMMGRTEGSSIGWRADFHRRRSDGWRKVRLVGIDWIGRKPRDFDLVLTTEPTQINSLLDQRDFSVQVPPTARAITLDELHRSNLLMAANVR